MQDQLNNLIQSYAGIASSTIGHVLDQEHLPQIHAINPIRHAVGRVRTATLHSVNGMALRQALLNSQLGDVLWSLMHVSWNIVPVGENSDIALPYIISLPL